MHGSECIKLSSLRIGTVQVRALKLQTECGKCNVGAGKEKEMYVLFRIKVLTKFNKREYNSLRTEPMHQHKQLVTDFSP
jgi:hypothetical protein